VREKYIELARKSSLLTSYYELPIQREVSNYFIEAPDEYEVFAVKGVGNPHGWSWNYPDAHHWFSNWGYRFYVRDNCEVIFETAPSSDETDRFILLTVIPSPCCASIPVSVATPYGKAIGAGAVADALRMPSKPWSNPELAKEYDRTFNRGVLSARNLAMTNRGAITPEFAPVRIL
jgi:hypothetical protein